MHSETLNLRNSDMLRVVLVRFVLCTCSCWLNTCWVGSSRVACCKSACRVERLRVGLGLRVLSLHPACYVLQNRGSGSGVSGWGYILQYPFYNICINLRIFIFRPLYSYSYYYLHIHIPTIIFIFLLLYSYIHTLLHSIHSLRTSVHAHVLGMRWWVDHAC